MKITIIQADVDLAIKEKKLQIPEWNCCPIFQAAKRMGLNPDCVTNTTLLLKDGRKFKPSKNAKNFIHCFDHDKPYQLSTFIFTPRYELMERFFPN